MFRHIVLYRLRPELGTQAQQRIDELIRSLATAVPGVLEVQTGPISARQTSPSVQSMRAGRSSSPVSWCSASRMVRGS
jgi:hypothetical protein